MSLTLPRGTTPTTRLGFGTAYLAGGFEERRNRRLVDVAFDAGIRHFDTAPAYGLGLAEDVLGRALAGRRERVTIASKVGLARPNVPTPVRVARLLAGPLRRRLGRVTRRVGQRRPQPARSRGRFEPAFVEASLAESLRRLRTDHVDLLLLHEIWPEDVTDELLTLLDKARRDGRCRAVGTATTPEDGRRLVAAHPGFFDVVQRAWSVLDAADPPPAPPPMTITHRAVLRSLEPLTAWFARDADAKRALAQAAAVDLDDRERLPALLLGAALAANPEGLTLVASRRAERVRSNALVLNDAESIAAGERLWRALAARADAPAPRD
jgi:aryl-alcohol dehydrogenase-like predicted oxidoreductase